MENFDALQEVKDRYNAWFKTTDFYIRDLYGDNASFKYITYRDLFPIYLAGFKSMLDLVASESYINEYGDACLEIDSKTEEFIYNDSDCLTNTLKNTID